MAYVPQTAWIRNATLRENVVFGQEDDEVRYATILLFKTVRIKG